MTTPNPYPFVLGRRVHHDPRNAQQQYAIAPLPKRAIKSVEWVRRVPIFNQGQVGSCTFNAAAGCYATDSAGRVAPIVATVKADSYGIFTSGTYAVQETPFVLDGYTLTTKIDPFPGDMPSQDTGSDGPSAAQTMVLLGLASQYNHAFSVDAVNAGLQLGAGMWGTVWLESMFDLNAHDQLVVDRNSKVAGGHEIEIVGYDVTTDEYKVANSWDVTWGDHGYFYASGPDLAWLLSQQGDFTQPVWATAPVPPPPVPPKPVLTGQQFYDKIKAVAKAGGLK